jgi:hypothetical protein
MLHLYEGRGGHSESPNHLTCGVNAFAATKPAKTTMPRQPQVLRGKFQSGNLSEMEEPVRAEDET